MNRELCTGCGVCAKKCPTKAIKMEKDLEGFSYPIIDARSCVGCGMCEDICHCNGDRGERTYKKIAYRVFSLDNSVRFNSTSGGVFSELASEVINAGGAIYGATYDYKTKSVKHLRISKIDDINVVRQSKYVESSLAHIYASLTEDINKNVPILFCGTPCQVAALQKYIGNVPDNVLFVDFACMGAASPKAFYYWIAEIEEKIGAKFSKCWFKYKDEGWRNSPLTTKLEFDDSQSIVLRGDDNLYMKGYVEDLLFMRPSCSVCKYKGINKPGDLTIGDFWGLREEMDDRCGVSFCIINTEKGQRLFERIKEAVDAKEISVEQACSNNRGMTDKVLRNEKANDFLGKLGSESFSALYEKYSNR